uniref:Uncharacterized protein n=1 Tax=Trypanosoma congolense (strain IL3000) TaxID=1068625 RepID=G0UTK9_TRYCI|nr:hypothetical protein, unlikely [Trypanosoma congolense IL3000]
MLSRHQPGSLAAPLRQVRLVAFTFRRRFVCTGEHLKAVGGLSPQLYSSRWLTISAHVAWQRPPGLAWGLFIGAAARDKVREAWQPTLSCGWEGSFVSSTGQSGSLPTSLHLGSIKQTV